MAQPIYAAKITPRLFRPEECARLIALDYPWEDAQVSSSGDADVVNPNWKVGRYKLLPREAATEWVYRRLAAFLKASGGFGFVIETIGAPLKVQMYPEGGFHAWHSDIGNPKSVNRKIAISVQLSDGADYDGGALQFFNHPQPAAAPRERGCAVAYPAFVPHQVTPVTRGTRYALTAWCLGPPFK